MKISPGIGHEPSLQRLVIASVVLHFILMAFLFIPFKTGEREFKNYYVSLVEPAKVSGGGEPAARKAEEKPSVKKEASVNNKKIAEEEAVAEKKEQMFQKLEKSRKAAEAVANEIDKLRTIKKLSEGKKERDNTRGIEAVKNEASAKGARGAPSKGAQITSDSYFALITGKIRNEWEIPPGFDSSGLEVEISIKIDSNGKVVSKTIEKSSGNDFFDKFALQAISKASPLPPPLTEMEIGMRFYP